MLLPNDGRCFGTAFKSLYYLAESIAHFWCHWSTKSILGDSLSFVPLLAFSISRPFTIFSMLFSSDGEFCSEFDAKISCGGGVLTIRVGETDIGRCVEWIGDVCWLFRGLLLKLRWVFDGGSNALSPDEAKLYGAKRLFELADGIVPIGLEFALRWSGGIDAPE